MRSTSALTTLSTVLLAMTGIAAAGTFTLQHVANPASDSSNPTYFCQVMVDGVHGCTGATDNYFGDCGDTHANDGQDTRQACGDTGIRINWGVPNVPIDFVNSNGDRTSCNLGGASVGTSCSPP